MVNECVLCLEIFDDLKMSSLKLPMTAIVSLNGSSQSSHFPKCSLNKDVEYNGGLKITAIAML